jgi:hypothetical protein
MVLAGWDPNKAREPAVSELALDFGISLTSRHLRVFADLIDKAPEEDRAALQLQALDLLARWLLKKSQAVGPDGRIVVGVKSWEKAKKIVAACHSQHYGTVHQHRGSKSHQAMRDESSPGLTCRSSSAIRLRSQVARLC